MGGALLAVVALLAVALIAFRSDRQRRRAVPDATVGAPLLVAQVKAERESFAGSEPDAAR